MASSTSTERSAPGGRDRRSPWAEVALFAVAALLPWFILDAQEQVRWGARSHLVWPLCSLTIVPVLAAATLLLARRPSRVLDALAPAGDAATRRLWLLAGAAAIAVAFPLAIGHFHDLAAWPTSAHRSDQIPFIELTLRDFWRDSRYPYHKYDVGHWYQASVYPPFLWLQYTLPYWFAVDLRTLTSASLLVLSVAMFGHAIVGAASTASWPARVACAVPAAVPLLLFVLPTWRESLLIVQTPCLWMMCAFLALAVRTRSWLASGILLALCACSRPWFLFAIPPMLVLSVANRRAMGADGLARFWGGLVVTGGAIGLPFLMFDPEAFLGNMLGSYSQYHGLTVANDPTTRHGFGFSQLLATLRIEDAAMPIALAVQAALFALACMRVRDERGAVRAMAVNLLWFSAFALVPFFYIFVEGLLLLAFAGPGTALEHASRRCVGRVRAAMAALGIAALFGFMAAGMFARPQVVPRTPMVVADSVLLIAGFDRQGWVSRSGGEPFALADRHAYLSASTEHPRLTKLALDIEAQDVPADTWLEVVLNGEPIGGIALGEGGRREHQLHVPRRNLKYGGNEIALHVGGRYGETSWTPGPSAIRIFGVRIGE